MGGRGEEGEGRTAVIGDGERGAEGEGYLYLLLGGRCCCERWCCTWLARGGIEAVLHQCEASVGRDKRERFGLGKAI